MLKRFLSARLHSCFFNGGREYDEKMGISSVKQVPSILFSGTDLLVTSSMREALLELDIPHLHMHSSVYIHDDGEWHEDYWYMTFVERFDCWSREKSDYDKDDEPITSVAPIFFRCMNFALAKSC